MNFSTALMSLLDLPELCLIQILSFLPKDKQVFNNPWNAKSSGLTAMFHVHPRFRKLLLSKEFAGLSSYGSPYWYLQYPMVDQEEPEEPMGIGAGSFVSKNLVMNVKKVPMCEKKCCDNHYGKEMCDLHKGSTLTACVQWNIDRVNYENTFRGKLHIEDLEMLQPIASKHGGEEVRQEETMEQRKKERREQDKSLCGAAKIGMFEEGRDHEAESGIGSYQMSDFEIVEGFHLKKIDECQQCRDDAVGWHTKKCNHYASLVYYS